MIKMITFRKRIALTAAIALIFCCFAVSALDDADKYLPKGGESWESNWHADHANIWENFLLSLSPFMDKGDVDPLSNADVYGWYNDSQFGLANWEREVCLADLSSDVRNFRNVVEDSYHDAVSVYTTTATVTATKDYGINNTYLYEVSWYIRPYGGDLLYRIYLTKGAAKYYVPPSKKGTGDDKWVDASRYTGASDYWVNYLNVSYDRVILEYRDAIGDGEYSENVNELNVSVVNKQIFGEESGLTDSGDQVDG